jgi:hypothetical protein
MEILTMTHARIRVGQGDVRGARRVLRKILERSPEDPEARAMLDELDGRLESDSRPDQDEPLAAVEPIDAARLAERFRSALGTQGPLRGVPGRVRRLETWLSRIRRADLQDH